MAEKKVSRFRQAQGTADDLVKRTQESYRTKDSSGKFETYLSKNLPLQQWKCKDGDHIIDIIPWLSGNNYPHMEEGKATYLLDLWAHMKIGVNECSYLCPSRNYDKPCPICEDIANMKKKAGYDEKYVKSISPKRRIVYAIMCYDSAKEEEAGPYIWEASHWLTEKNISAIARNRRTGGYVAFANPDTGKSIEFTKEGTGEGTKYTGYKFGDRDYTISDEILEAVPSLDQYIELLPYEDLKNIYLGSSGDGEEEPQTEQNYDKEEEDTSYEPAPKEEKKEEKKEETRTSRAPLTRRDQASPEEKKEPEGGRVLRRGATTEAPVTRRGAETTAPVTGATTRQRIGRRQPAAEDDIPY